MSAHDQVRAMLDELMGTARDGEHLNIILIWKIDRVLQSLTKWRLCQSWWFWRWIKMAHIFKTVLPTVVVNIAVFNRWLWNIRFRSNKFISNALMQQTYLNYDFASVFNNWLLEIEKLGGDHCPPHYYCRFTVGRKMDLTTPQSSTLRFRSRSQINNNSNTDTGDTDSLDFVWLGGCVFRLKTTHHVWRKPNTFFAVLYSW